MNQQIFRHKQNVVRSKKTYLQTLRVRIYILRWLCVSNRICQVKTLLWGRRSQSSILRLNLRSTTHRERRLHVLGRPTGSTGLLPLVVRLQRNDTINNLGHGPSIKIVLRKHSNFAVSNYASHGLTFVFLPPFLFMSKRLVTLSKSDASKLGSLRSWTATKKLRMFSKY